MPRIRANRIDIEYETFGSPSDRPLLLIMGFGSQLIAWPEEFCRGLAAAGHFVVRYDNRDVGLSTHLDHIGVPAISQIMADLQAGRAPELPYTLSDMAGDAVGLMDALGMEKAHVCGLSMGGFIAQILAISHPRRLKSIVSMESSTGAHHLPPAKPGVLEALIQPAPAQRAAYIDHMLNLYRLFAGGSERFDEALQADIAARAFDRAFHPAGVARHYSAILTAANREKALGAVRLPALVIHGDADSLLPPDHGRATAAAIPGARFLCIEGLGHGMAYPGLWPEMIDAIAAHTRASDAPDRSGPIGARP